MRRLAIWISLVLLFTTVPTNIASANSQTSCGDYAFLHAIEVTYKKFMSANKTFLSDRTQADMDKSLGYHDTLKNLVSFAPTAWNLCSVVPTSKKSEALYNIGKLFSVASGAFNAANTLQQDATAASVDAFDASNMGMDYAAQSVWDSAPGELNAIWKVINSDFKSIDLANPRGATSITKSAKRVCVEDAYNDACFNFPNWTYNLCIQNPTTGWTAYYNGSKWGVLKQFASIPDKTNCPKNAPNRIHATGTYPGSNSKAWMELIYNPLKSGYGVNFSLDVATF